jgi:hypothetical protein
MRPFSRPAFSGDDVRAWRHRALVFAGQARDAQSISGKKLTGGNSLSPESLGAIRKAISGRAIADVIGKAGTGDVACKLFERFEEMCRRRRFTVDAELRPALFEILAGELAANHAALGGSAARLVAVTVLQGAIGPELTADPEFARFRQSPGVFTQAAVNHPSDPGTFLRRLSATIDALAKDEELKRFRKTPFVFTKAAMHYPLGPGNFLRKASAAMDKLAREPEFKRFRRTPFVFAKAALVYPSDPRAFLRKAAGAMDAIAREPEFKHLREAPGLFTRAALGYPSDPRAYLRATSTDRSRKRAEGKGKNGRAASEEGAGSG